MIVQAFLWREGGGEVRVEILTVEMRVGFVKEKSPTCVCVDRVMLRLRLRRMYKYLNRLV